jgi:AraC-like DNA-binding protein
MSAAPAENLSSTPALLQVSVSKARPRVAEPHLGAVLGKLLEAARDSLHFDRGTAEACLARACELLQVARERDELRTHDAAPVLPRKGLAAWQIRRVKTFIDERLGASIKIADFATLTGLSPSYFSRAFKGSFGESPHAYIVRRRMERVQELMLTSDESLCQIALSCGLADQSHLSKLFRQVIGVTPNAWRRARRGHAKLAQPRSGGPFAGAVPG